MKTKISMWAGLVLLLTIFSTVFLTSCEEDEKQKTLPEVITAEMSNVSTTSATGGGEIVSDGNDDIAASGLVYSSTNATPTLTDSKTEETMTDDSFISHLEGLTSSTTYHVRAYATNSVGTGYGEVVEFTTGNAPPVATDVDVTFTGDLGFDVGLTASYVYSDAESDDEEGTTFQWYIANDIAGAGETAIASATTSTYSIRAADEFKYIRVAVTPKAATGSLTGVEMKSAFAGPIPESPETVTFIYNTEEVTYAVITSSVTGRKWMDRNLGAQKAAANVRDYEAYGDLFQHGRLADGHQLITWTSNVTEGSLSAPVNGTIETQSTTDLPGHSSFIAPGSLVDWRNPKNPTLWQAPNYVNNPCPSGWHIPTKEEWAAENLEMDFAEGADIGLLTNRLKLTSSGARRYNNGSFSSVGYDIYYWTSSRSTSGTYSYFYSASLDPADGPNKGKIIIVPWFSSNDGPATGLSCRCIKNE
jgi:uncharacterized protein (TIGR02145 family)